MQDIVKLLSVKPVEHYKIYLQYQDGIQGTVDLSHLVGKGVFSYFNDYSSFEKVHIDEESGAIARNKDLDICPYSMYLRLTGKESL